MKKSKNLKRIGAVMLSLVLAVSTVFTTTAVSEKKVSAQAEIKNKKQLQRWALATKLLSDGEWGDKIMELMDAVDKYIPDSQSEIDQASSIHTKFTAEVYMLDINEGGRDTGYFDGDRLHFYFKTTDVTGEIQLPIEIDMVMPGETLDITIELIQPIKITEEEPFIIRNDECTVGLGRISTIIE